MVDTTKQDTASLAWVEAATLRSSVRAVELTLAPGASVARIALRHRLNTDLLSKWRRRQL